MAFNSQTVSRLVVVLKGFIPTAVGFLLLSGLAIGGSAIGGATLSFMGLALGGLVGLPCGRWLADRTKHESDRRLPLVLSLVFLPLALLPAQPEVIGLYRFGFHGWISVLIGVMVAFPLGASLTCSWSLLVQEPELARRSRIIWGGSGVGLGVMIGTGTALAVSTFKGAFLVNLFAAPLVWPTLPFRGERSLLIRMLLTLVVVLSTMFLLFLRY